MDPTNDADLRAAVAALRARRPRDAVAILTSLLQRAETAGLTHDLMLARGLLAPAYATLGELDAARSVCHEALRLAQLLQDEESIAQYEGLLEQLEAPGIDERAAEFVQGRSDDAHLDAVAAALIRGERAVARAGVIRLLEDAEREGRAGTAARALALFGQLHLLEGDINGAVSASSRAMIRARDVGDADLIAQLQQRLALMVGMGQVELLRIGPAFVRAQASLQRASRALERGDHDAALQVLFPALRGARDAGLTPAEASLRGVTAQALLMAERREEASHQAALALRLADELGDAEASDGFRRVLELCIGLVPPMANA